MEYRNGRLLNSINRPVRPGLISLKLQGRDQSINVSLSFSFDGKRLAIGSRDGDFAIHDVATREPLVAVIESRPGGTDMLAQLSRGGLQTVRVPNIGGQGIPVDELLVDQMSNPGIAFSPDGSMLATTNINNVVTIRDAASGASRTVCAGTSSRSNAWRLQTTGNVWRQAAATAPSGSGMWRRGRC